MKPTVKYEHDANEHFERVLVKWDVLRDPIIVQRTKEDAENAWGEAVIKVPSPAIYYLSAVEAEAFSAALTLAARIARAWDAGEPLPEGEE